MVLHTGQDCTNVVAPINGARDPDTPNIDHTATVTLTCIEGYTLSGDDTSTCMGATLSPDISGTTCGKVILLLKLFAAFIICMSCL